MSGFPTNWNDDARNCLKALARQATRHAQQYNGDWVKAVQGLESKIRFDSRTGQFEIRGYIFGTVPSTVYASNFSEAWEALRRGCAQELGGGVAEHPGWIIQQDILGPGAIALYQEEHP